MIERVYRVLLRLYPREFRTRYGRDMERVFREARLGAGGLADLSALCARSAWDALVHGVGMRIRRHTAARLHPREKGEGILVAFRARGTRVVCRGAFRGDLPLPWPSGRLSSGSAWHSVRRPVPSFAWC